jgi:peptidoglycan/LPS O-acetylase OafA/YrhL
MAHAYALSGFEELAWLPNAFSSVAAVKAFFVVSGFLIFMSYERSATMRSYFLKRARRIYPAYFTVVMLCAVSLWAVSSLPIDRYLSFDLLKYVFSNLAFLNFLHPGLPGVFEGFRYPVVNGALWTLKIEVMFYVSVPVLVMLCRRFGHFRMLAVIYLASVCYAFLLNDMADARSSALYRELARQLPGQLSYFVAGAFFYYFLPLFERYVAYFLLLALSVLMVDSYIALPLLEPLALATVVSFFGLFIYAGNAGRYGDFSYGIYILHFPVIQLLLYGGWFSNSAYEFLATAMAVTLLASVAMWHLVEKRFLFRNSHYLEAEHGEKAA